MNAESGCAEKGPTGPAGDRISGPILSKDPRGARPGPRPGLPEKDLLFSDLVL